jgi:cytochrome P450
MNRDELRFAFQTLPFLDSHEGDSAGVVELRARPTPRLLVWHPEGIDWIFRADRQLHHVPSRTLRPLRGRKSLLGVEGLRHAAYRRVLGPSLRGHQLQLCHNIISYTVQSAIDVLAPGAVISLIEWARKVTLRVTSQILLGRAENLLLESFSARVESVLSSRSRTLAHRYLYVHALSIFARQALLRGYRELDEMLLRSAKATATAQRMLTADGELLGRPLPAGTIVTPCMYLAHRQPDLFPNLRRFDPSRFLGNRVSRQCYFPFGGGTRRCLGSELAILEVRMIAAAVLRRCQLHCVNPEAGILELRGPALTLAPGLRMSIIPHRMAPRNIPA